MRTVNIHAAKTQLSRLVEAAAAGEEIVIARAGRPMAKLVAASSDKARRRLGLLGGRLRIPTDFDASLPEAVLESFEKPDAAIAGHPRPALGAG